VVVGMFIVAFFAVLGGMKGITWTQVVQYFVLILAFIIPALALSYQLTGNPVPQAGMVAGDIAQELNSAQERLGFADYTRPFGALSRLNVLCYTFALMAGTAGLPHVIVRFYTVGSVRAARYSAGWALLFIALLYTTAPALAMFARYNILDNLDGAVVSAVEITVAEGAAEPVTHVVQIADAADREAALAEVAQARADQRDYDARAAEAPGSLPQRTTKFLYQLLDKDERHPIGWVETWQRTELVAFNDADGDGTIKLDAVVLPPAAAPDNAEVVLNAPLRDGLLRQLDGARVLPAAGDGASGQPRSLESDLGIALDWAGPLQADGKLTIRDVDNDGRVKLGPELDRASRRVGGFAEATIDPDTIVLSTPEVAGLPGWVIALVATGGLAAALSTAAGLLLVISSSIAHDLYIHFVEPHAPESRRLAVGRMMIIAAIVVAGYFGVNPPDYVAAVVAFAFGLAAASFFPVILLGVFDKRANREGAIAGMVVGLTFTAVYIMGCKADKIFGLPAPLWGNWCFGILPEGIGTIGCLLNMAVMLVVSRLTPPPPKHVQELIESVRVPRGSHEPEAHFDEEDAEADNP
ncbi:MAG: hypothetical protein KDA41_15145, partial [Planctomycetales bacterium]|nr:hypothetical protein [Planctomycetales bacterium]